MHLKVTWSAVLMFTILYQSHSSTKAETLPNAEIVKYAVIMDAGSSGTRVKVYEYVEGRHDPIEPSDMRQVEVPPPDKIKPGLSTFADSIDQIQYYLDEPIENAMMVVPADKQAETPIMLFATAGMRLLPEDEQDAIMAEVDRLFSDKSFCPFLYTEGNARVIPGGEESGYGWVTVNFLKGIFSLPDTTHTYGVLDLGGASAENTFMISVKSKTLPPTLTVELAGKTYPLYARSDLGYGADEARDSYIESLKPQHGSLISPCHNNNYKTTVTIDNQEYQLTGQYDGKLCQSYIKKLFFCNFGENCPLRDQPALKGQYYGISTFYYALHDSGIISSHDKIVSLGRIRLNARIFCKQPAESLDPKIYDVYNLCFRLNYIYELLKNGYDINWKTFLFRVADELSGFDLNWSLGAVLYNSKIL